MHRKTMGKYYVTVTFMRGKTQKVEALNKELRVFEDMLITTDGSMEIVMTNIEELVGHLNELHKRSAVITASRWKSLNDKWHISVKGGADQYAGITFNPIKSER